MDQVLTIDEVLREYESTCKDNSSSSRGLWCELKTISYLRENNYRIIACRPILIGIEVDLIAISKSGFVSIVEVKSGGSFWFQKNRISQRQLGRLRRVVRYLSKVLKTKVDLKFSLVTDKGRVKLLDEIHFMASRGGIN